MSAPTDCAASSVAKILRDRALAEQVEVNGILRAELDASLKVEITGSRGEPVYAQGDFRDGGRVGLSGEWMVWMDKWPSKAMPLSKFMDTEVRVGGIATRIFTSGKMTAGIHTSMGRIIIAFGSPSRLCWGSFQLIGLPENSLERLDTVQKLNTEVHVWAMVHTNANREADNDGVNILDNGIHEVLCEIAETYPTTTVCALSVTFGTKFECVTERAKRCRKQSKGSLRSNLTLPIIMRPPKLVATLAEALKDKVLMTQLETNQAIYDEIEASLKVEITSAAGDIICAQGAFQDRRSCASGVMVPMACTPPVVGIALSGLNRLEVRVGGITAYTCPSTYFLRRRNQFCERNQFILYIGRSNRFCVVVLQLHGLPKQSLELLEATMNHNREVEYGADSHDIIEVLNQLDNEHPNARAHPVETGFYNSLEKPLIERAKSFAQIGSIGK